MPFDVQAFEQVELRPRTRRVPVAALAAWFGPGEEPEWEVRGLNANELHRALEAGKRQTGIDEVVKAIATSGDRAQAVRRALGLVASDTPGEIAKRLELLVAGSVAPQIELPTAVKLAETFPIEFLMLTNAITELTGQGFDLVKPAAASPMTPDSSPACESANPEAASSTNTDPT